MMLSYSRLLEISFWDQQSTLEFEMELNLIHLSVTPSHSQKICIFADFFSESIYKIF